MVPVVLRGEDSSELISYLTHGFDSYYCVREASGTISCCLNGKVCDGTTRDDVDEGATNGATNGAYVPDGEAPGSDGSEL